MKIGELAEKYEVGSRGPGFISDGDKWDPGGDSYGSYQLATKVGTLQAYLKTELPYVAQLRKYPIKSKAFNSLWKRLAEKDPEGFKQSQFDFVKTLSYEPCRYYATKIGIADTLAINSALFSMSNQHGGWKKILDGASIDSTDSEITQIEKLYESRKSYINSLKTLTKKLKANLVETRCVQEKNDCLRLAVSNDLPSGNTKVALKAQNVLESVIEAFKAIFTKKES